MDCVNRLLFWITKKLSLQELSPGLPTREKLCGGILVATVGVENGFGRKLPLSLQAGDRIKYQRVRHTIRHFIREHYTAYGTPDRTQVVLLFQGCTDPLWKQRSDPSRSSKNICLFFLMIALLMSFLQSKKISLTEFYLIFLLKLNSFPSSHCRVCFKNLLAEIIKRNIKKVLTNKWFYRILAKSPKAM